MKKDFDLFNDGSIHLDFVVSNDRMGVENELQIMCID